jgi:hypothetical protein
MANTNVVANYPGVQEVIGMVISPNGGAVFYVATAAQVAALGETGECIASRVSPTVDKALAQCVSGRGDFVYILPGYTETVSAADQWASLGTKTAVSVIGLGTGMNRPTFTYSAAGATILMDAASMSIRNCIFYMAGATGSTTALTVAAPITISAAGCAITDNYIHFGVDADQLVTIGVTTTAAATQFEFKRNQCYGATLAVCTSFLYLVGADNCQIWDNTIIGGTSSVNVGVVRFITTASIGIDFRRNTFTNLTASSVHAVTQMTGVLGQVSDCGFGILNDSGLAGWVPAGAGNGPQFFRCYTANLAGESGGLMTPIST